MIDQVELAIKTVMDLFPASYRLPRYVMTCKTHGQIEAFSYKHLYNILREAELIDCYIRIHSEEEISNYIVSIVFLDIDLKNNLKKARSVALKIAENIKKDFGGRPHIQFSGSKGYHVIQPIKPVKCESIEEAKEFLKYIQTVFAGRYSKYVDRCVLGDVKRLFRIPYSIHGETGNLVEVIRKWNHNRIYLNHIYYKFKLSRLAEQRTTKYRRRRRYGIKIEGEWRIYGNIIYHSSLEGYGWIKIIVENRIFFPDARETFIWYVLSKAVTIGVVPIKWAEEWIRECVSRYPAQEKSVGGYIEKLHHNMRADIKPPTWKTILEESGSRKAEIRHLKANILPALAMAGLVKHLGDLDG